MIGFFRGITDRIFCSLARSLPIQLSFPFGSGFVRSEIGDPWAVFSLETALEKRFRGCRDCPFDRNLYAEYAATPVAAKTTRDPRIDRGLLPIPPLYATSNTGYNRYCSARFPCNTPDRYQGGVSRTTIMCG